MEKPGEVTKFKNLEDFIRSTAIGIISKALSQRTYTHIEANKWTNLISEELTKTLSERNKNFKFITTCLIIQKSDAGMNMSSSYFWDSQHDGNVVVKWETESLVCVVSVYGTIIDALN